MIHRWEGWLRVIWGHFLGCAGPRGLSGEGAEGVAPHHAGWAGSGLQLMTGVLEGREHYAPAPGQ